MGFGPVTSETRKPQPDEKKDPESNDSAGDFVSSCLNIIDEGEDSEKESEIDYLSTDGGMDQGSLWNHLAKSLIVTALYRLLELLKRQPLLERVRSSMRKLPMIL